ncbi:trigger factor [Patescibacteria group bacterium]|nr:trigger factor [Patescibacteria group bacterium]MBU1705484.1 trigger factor [Patescibacteria group bacterium]
MATHTREDLEKNRVKLTITVPKEETRPHMEEAAKRLAQNTKIDGFRPGKADYEVIRQKFGEMKILEEALENIVRKTFVQAVLEQEIDTVGQPKIEMEKMVPSNDLVYTAEVTRMPKVTKLADFKTLSVKAKKPEIEDKDIDLALKDLQRMQTKETRGKEGSIVDDQDKVVLSVNMKKDGVPVDGGQSPNHAIFLSEEYYIPGFKEQLLGLKEGEEKKFVLTFPEDHVQKMIAGAEVEFEVAIKEIFHLDLPEINDEFAKSLGQKDLETMKGLIRENLQKEKDSEEKFRQEKEMLELIADKSRFEDIPDLLLNEEINKMAHELQHRVEDQGMEFDKYLESIKRTLADLKLDFTPQALMRIKVALLLSEIARREKVEVDQKEMDQELDALAERYQDNEEAKKQIYSPVYREYMESMQRNRKVIDLLRNAMVK